MNVGYNVFKLNRSQKKEQGTLWKGEYIEHREKLTGEEKNGASDEDVVYLNSS